MRGGEAHLVVDVQVEQRRLILLNLLQIPKTKH